MGEPDRILTLRKLSNDKSSEAMADGFVNLQLPKINKQWGELQLSELKGMDQIRQLLSFNDGSFWS